MEVTRGTLYAVYVLIYFHLRPAGEVADLHKLSDALDVPQSYLSKVLQQLHKAGYLVSQMGSKGGYKLARQVEKTTMKEILHVIQGETHIQECLMDHFDCNRFRKCAVNQHIREIQSTVDRMLDQLTIGQLASEMEFQQKPVVPLHQIDLGVQ
ncbi:MAG TPA: Rrf2 family transcriptional regulator [Acidobacteriota bacterium]